MWASLGRSDEDVQGHKGQDREPRGLSWKGQGGRGQREDALFLQDMEREGLLTCFMGKGVVFTNSFCLK